MVNTPTRRKSPPRTGRTSRGEYLNPRSTPRRHLGENRPSNKNNDDATPTTTTAGNGSSIAITRKSRTNNEPATHFNRDFFPFIEKQINIEHIGNDHVLSIKHRQQKVMPAKGNTIPDATMEEKRKALEFIISMRKMAMMKIRSIMSNKIVSYAANVLLWKRYDGQPVASWPDVLQLGKNQYMEGNLQPSYSLFYEQNFLNGWEKNEETMYMLEMNMFYRAWMGETRVKKGFIAQLYSRALNEFRKKFFWVKRRTAQLIDNKGNKIRRRCKSTIVFNENEHGRNETPKIVNGIPRAYGIMTTDQDNIKR
jgi:hypothetical protein